MTTLPLVMRLPYPLSANRYWRPVPIRGKGGVLIRTMIVPTDEAKAFKEDIGWRVKAYGVRAPLQGRLSVDIRVYPARPQDWAKRTARDPLEWDTDVRCIDIDNARKVFFDAFNGVLWGDDAQVWRDSAERMEPAGDAQAEVTVSRYVRECDPQLQLAVAT